MRQDGFFDWLASDLGKAAVAGALGGLVRWITLRDNWKEGSAAIFTGCVCAVFLSPAAEPILVPALSLATTEQAARDLVPFVIGLGGVGIAGFLIDFVAARLKGGTDGKQ